MNPSPPTTPPRRRALVAAATLAALLAAAWLAWWALVPTSDELARRVEAVFEARMGQKLVVGQVRWRVLGRPMVEVLDARTVQPEVIRVRRVAIYPQLMPLLRQRLAIDRLELDGALVPHGAMAAYRGKTPDESGAMFVRAVAFNDLTYISYSGIPVVYEGDIHFDDDRLVHRLRLRRPGVEPPVSLDATRDGKADGGADLYQLRVQAAGGSARGQARLATSAEGRMVLTGELAPRGVEVNALLEAFHRHSPINGAASGETELRAEGDTAGELFRTLHTRSVLRVERAKILRFDIDKAVKSLGEDRAGETPLDSLTGVMDTQNTEQGMKTTFTQVEAVAGNYTATGQATLYRKRVDAQGQLEIGGGIVDVPISAHGPLRKPEFSIAWGTIAGAAIGTAVLPGIGTVIGAKIGGAVTGPPKAPPASPRSR
ncbi:hypothetical protein IG197_35595 (plasmid) [Aminobacter sp. SR38]|uniref:AsmA-like C-terminal region-containing protein n=1 Tax=Aminobacter sp. SR38 TaxID=2774562 RepID=UPI0012E10D22|nr:AsmA-like C-terminal region-containing protein [Aminobacter sp. SR38]QOF75832.1 hypothetical protein IG197_35595 [Aminobacter sp. SR38]